MNGLLGLCIWTAVVFVFPADAYSCPPDCFCSEHWMWSRTVFVVTRNFRNLSSVPNLSSLAAISLPVFVKLSYSNLSRVTKEDFPSGLGITYLSLGGNRRLVVEDDALSNLGDSLVYLDLESTQLFFNATLTFLRGLSKLEHLILSYNNKYNYQTVAPDITANLFGGLGLSSLKKLKMYNCGIRTMAEKVFQDAETVEELDLGANGLNAVPDAVATIPNVQSLDLSHSMFEVVRTRTFIQNKQLRTLILIYSKVKFIDAGTFDGVEASLHTLDVRNSCLTEVPADALKTVTALKVLKLDGNKIRSISAGSLSGSYCLDKLSLSNTDLTFSDDMFQGQENCIEQLELRGMNLGNIPLKPLTTLLKLRNLFLNNNHIHELKPYSLSGIKAHLFVFTGNPLRNIQSEAFEGTNKPLYLSIDFTQINNLKFILEYPKGTFESLDVTGLPISCDCTTARVVKIMGKRTMSGTCGNMETGAGIGLQTDTVYQYLSRKCPGILDTSGIRPLKAHGATVFGAFLFFVSTTFRL